MPPPWEKYQAAAPQAGAPWQKYQQQTPAPAALNVGPGAELSAPSRPPMPTTGTAEGFGQNLLTVGQGVADAALDMGRTAAELGNPRHTATHYRGLANLLGLPVDPPSKEDADAYTMAALEALALAGGGAAGKAISAGAQAALKQVGRGFRTRPAAQQTIDEARHAGTLVERGAPTTTLRRELGAGAALGAAINAPGDVLYPGDIPDWLEPILGGMAPAVQHFTVGHKALLAGNPRFREFVMSPSRGGALSQLLGMTTAYFIAKGIEPTPETLDQAFDWAMSSMEGGR